MAHTNAIANIYEPVRFYIIRQNDLNFVVVDFKIKNHHKKGERSLIKKFIEVVL